MSLGNYKEESDYFNGVCIGSTSSSDTIKVGNYCEGATYDGKSIGRFALDLESIDGPEMDVTNIQGKYLFACEGGPSRLEDWEKLFKDALVLIKELKHE